MANAPTTEQPASDPSGYDDSYFEPVWEASEALDRRGELTMIAQEVWQRTEYDPRRVRMLELCLQVVKGETATERFDALDKIIDAHFDDVITQVGQSCEVGMELARLEELSYLSNETRARAVLESLEARHRSFIEQAKPLTIEERREHQIRADALSGELRKLGEEAKAKEAEANAP